MLYPIPLSLLPQPLTILLLISWKWISHTFSTMSSLSNVTKPNPEDKAKLLDQVRALHSLHPLLRSFYWQEKRRILQSALSQRAVTLILPLQQISLLSQEEDHPLTDSSFLLILYFLPSLNSTCSQINYIFKPPNLCYLQGKPHGW